MDRDGPGGWRSPRTSEPQAALAAGCVRPASRGPSCLPAAGAGRCSHARCSRLLAAALSGEERSCSGRSRLQPLVHCNRQALRARLAPAPAMSGPRAPRPASLAVSSWRQRGQGGLGRLHFLAAIHCQMRRAGGGLCHAWQVASPVCWSTHPGERLRHWPIASALASSLPLPPAAAARPPEARPHTSAPFLACWPQATLITQHAHGTRVVRARPQRPLSPPIVPAIGREPTHSRPRCPASRDRAS